MAVKVGVEPVHGQEKATVGSWLSRNWLWIVVILFGGIILFIAYKLVTKLLKKDENVDYAELEFKKTVNIGKKMGNRRYVGKNIIPTLIVWALILLFIDLFLIFGMKAIKTTYQFWISQLIFLPIAGGFAWIFHKISPFSKGARVYVRSPSHGSGYYSDFISVGEYVGDYIGEDGYHNIVIKNTKFLFFPAYEVIKCNVKGEYDLETTSDGKKIVKKVKLPTNFVRFYDDRIEILADGLEQMLGAKFLYPVAYNSTNFDVYDYRLVNADRLKNSILIPTIVNLTSDFANAQRNAIKMNPTLRFEQQRKSDEVEINVPRENGRESEFKR